MAEYVGWVAIHAEMKEGILAPHTEYASKPLRDHLKRTVSFRLFTLGGVLMVVCDIQRPHRKQIKSFCLYWRMRQEHRSYGRRWVYSNARSFSLIFRVSSLNLLKP